MAANFNRFLVILSKWPYDDKIKIMDYGYHLRQLVKNKNIVGEVFPGSSAENSEKLNSLFRIVNNVYGDESKCFKKVGASGLDIKAVENFLKSDFIKSLRDDFKTDNTEPVRSRSKIFFWR